MFIILLRFSHNKDQASQHIEGHKDWLSRGFTDGVFSLAGSIQPGLGGAILAHSTSLSELQMRVGQDPFVEQEIVSAEIVEVAPSKVEERLEFLIGSQA